MPADPPRRQLIPCRDLRFPSSDDDSLTQGEVRARAQGLAGGQGTLEDFLLLVRSQVRLVQGTQAWTMPPSPVDPSAGRGPFEPGVGQVILHELVEGARDGVNKTFVLSHFAVGPSVILTYNGLPQAYGNHREWVLAESTIDGGFDRVVLTGAAAPRARDELRVTYVRSA